MIDEGVKEATIRALEWTAARLMDEGHEAIFGSFVEEYREGQMEAGRVAAAKAVRRLIRARLP